MCQLDKIKPDYTTSLSDLKSKVKINPLEITKILDPVLFNEENVSLLSEHLNNSKQKSLAFHTSQNKNLTKPSIRKDVKYLDSWLKDMLGQIEQRKSDYSFQAMIEDLQIIYSACLQELIKQISLHCSERGQMVERIWNCYLDLLEKAIINTNKEKSQMEKQFLSDITRIYNGFEKETDNYKKEISNLKSKNQESSEKISQYYNELLYLRLKNHRSEKENGFLRSHSEDLLKDLKEMANQLYNYQTSTEINLEKSQNFEKLEEKKTNFLKVHDKYKKTFIKEIENLVNREYEIEENTIAEKGVNTEELYKEVSESIVTNEPLQILQSKEEKQFPEIVNKIFSDMKKKENVISHKEIQVNLKDFIACPELINPSSESFDEISNKIEQEKDIFDKKEKVILDTLKSFDKLTKKILLTQKDHSNEKIKNAFHMIKSHLVENLEIKRELFAINEELSYFVKENKKLRYTYQKNQSDLEEINERFSILNETYDSLQKKVNIFKKTIGKISKHQELIESFNRNEKELDHNRRLSISKVNKIRYFI